MGSTAVSADVAPPKVMDQAIQRTKTKTKGSRSSLRLRRQVMPTCRAGALLPCLPPPSRFNQQRFSCSSHLLLGHALHIRTARQHSELFLASFTIHLAMNRRLLRVFPRITCPPSLPHWFTARVQLQTAAANLPWSIRWIKNQ